MTSDARRRRVENLEAKGNPTNAVLKFENGSTRAITIRGGRQRRLELFCRAMNRIHFAANGAPEIPPGSVAMGKSVSKHDQLIDLIGHAESVESDDVFIRGLVFQMCHEAIEEEKKRRSDE
jgi:hypothetical protein